jgi:hypothetical protein
LLFLCFTSRENDSQSVALDFLRESGCGCAPQAAAFLSIVSELQQMHTQQVLVPAIRLVPDDLSNLPSTFDRVKLTEAGER